MLPAHIGKDAHQNLLVPIVKFEASLPWFTLGSCQKGSPCFISLLGKNSSHTVICSNWKTTSNKEIGMLRGPKIRSTLRLLKTGKENTVVTVKNNKGRK